ncbi:hypothetical protein RHODO2019_10825 [Rhodococcus antarcticus]|uniref:Uncharacterized protein n=1 Tax=Rhodococcus antarcticus TaxID=2987751 RepID=A0ABY6NWE2_9NOCA|nr:hypothetical protein [Rhodococcus antarcticus]UZJ23701.1 hypothetical protein RHODO2019_10825 [Rhodococcus antarcticus]
MVDLLKRNVDGSALEGSRTMGLGFAPGYCQRSREIAGSMIAGVMTGVFLPVQVGLQ